MGLLSRIPEQAKILLGIYVGYGALMLCRTSVGVLGPALLSDETLGFSKSDFGLILGFGMAGTILGKALVGIVADRWGGKRTLLLSVGLTACMAIAFSLSHSLVLFCAVSFTMLFSKAAGWPAMTNLVKDWFEPRSFGKVFGFLSTSSRVSAVLGTLAIGSLLFWFGWREILALVGVLALAIVAFNFFVLTDKEALTPAPVAKKEDPLALALGFFKTRLFWLMVLSLSFLAGVMELNSFAPLFLMETCNLEGPAASMLSSLFPAGCLLSVVLSGFIFDGLSKRQRIYMFAGLLLSMSLLFMALTYVPSMLPNDTVRAGFTAGIIFLVGVCIGPCYYLPCSIYSLEHGKKNPGFLIGLIEAFSYFAAMSFDFSIGVLVSENGDWTVFLQVLTLLALAALVFTVLFMQSDWKLSAQSAEGESLETVGDGHHVAQV